VNPDMYIMQEEYFQCCHYALKLHVLRAVQEDSSSGYEEQIMRLTNILRVKETRSKPLLVRIDVATRASSALCHTRSNLRLSTPVGGENEVDSNGGNVVSFTLERL
jgi:hypothetical protein